jgi:putative oxidoreductase
MIGEFLKSCSRFADLPLRLALSSVLIGHSAQKLFCWFGGQGLSATAEHFESIGFHHGLVWAMAIWVVKLLCGICLLVGLFTRWVALLVAVLIALGIVVFLLPNGFFLTPTNHGYEYSLTLALAALALSGLGPGRLSLDARLKRGFRR